MKVLMACQNHPDEYNPYWGTFIERSINSIVKEGIDVEAIIPRPHVLPIKGLPHSYFSKLPSKDESGAYTKYYPRYFYFPPKRLFYGLSGNSYAKNVTKFAKKNIEIPDVIHAHHVFMDGYGMLKLSKEWDIPLIMVEHGTILKEILNWKSMHNKIIKTLDAADHIMCVSEDLFSIALAHGVDEEKVSLVPIGVDIDVFKKRDDENLKELFGIDSDVKIILYVGQLVPKKGLNYLINAIPQVLDKHNKTCFIFVGYGPQREYLTKLCVDKNIQSNIIFVGGVGSERLIDWYSIADILVLPSLSEGRPTVIYEAMACELPVIATDVGGVSEQVENGYNGFVIKPRDSHALADSIINLLENDDLRKDMGENCRKRIIEQGWTWDNHAKNVIEIYKRVL
ncbi:MAG TPA: glycosyltransferase family 4 protein [Methanosarcinaceae archaeon]|nr:glycosyltransferase family 4 protein [Methanosarcinaceae archaeon]